MESGEEPRLLGFKVKKCIRNGLKMLFPNIHFLGTDLRL